jgi:NAD(P)H-nitrite reductase large subunit
LRLLVIGGSDAGISAGLRARELDPTVEVSLLVADAYPNFSICGLPYYLSGDVADWRSLAHRTSADLEAAGLRLLLDYTAQAIDPAAKQVSVTDPAGTERQLGYDRLVIATGAVPVRLPIDGLDLPGVHVLHTMGDTFALHKAVDAGVRSVVIVGGGYIGLWRPASAGRCGWTGICAPTWLICWPLATVSRPGIGCLSGPRICRLAPPPTSKAASPARPPSGAMPASPAR